MIPTTGPVSLLGVNTEPPKDTSSAKQMDDLLDSIAL